MYSGGNREPEQAVKSIHSSDILLDKPFVKIFRGRILTFLFQYISEIPSPVMVKYTVWPKVFGHLSIRKREKVKRHGLRFFAGLPCQNIQSNPIHMFCFVTVVRFMYVVLINMGMTNL